MMYDQGTVLAITFAGFHLSLSFIITWSSAVSSSRGFEYLSYIVVLLPFLPVAQLVFYCSRRDYLEL